MAKSVRFLLSKLGILSAMVFFTAGCASISIPQYVKDDYPYKHKIYASFEDVSSATKDVLDSTGWVVLTTTDPSVFERTKDIGGPEYKQILLISDVRQTAFFVGSRYARVNVYIRSSNADYTEIEVRYVTVSSMFFKNFYKYRNDAEVNRIFRHIEEKLSVTPEHSS